MTKRALTIPALLILLSFSTAGGAVVWLEAEGFDKTGKWSNDSQHVDLMGSPYLLATGVGKPVEDAVTTAQIPAPGKYTLWVRCRDWLPSHSPGQFKVLVGGKASDVTFGKAKSDDWRWVDGGAFDLKAGPVEVAIRDLTGWWGRCDAVVLAPESFKPAGDAKKLAAQRIEFCGVTPDAKPMGDYDVVVIGGGPAGMGAATAAARHECKVAFIQDRPVLGGNSSSEIQVPPMGYIGRPPDRVNITGLAEEFFPEQGWASFADSKKMEAIVRAEKNISLFLNTRGIGVEMSTANSIKSVIALDVRTGQRMSFAAPLFIDCTGHGWIGYYAKAEYRMGQEARAEFNESLAPVRAGKRTMGNTLYYAAFKDHRPDRKPQASSRIAPAPGVVIKYSDKTRVTITGDWTHSTFQGGDYLHDADSAKGEKSVVFTFDVKQAGRREVFLGYLAFNNRAKNVPVTVEHAGGKTKVTVDQTVSKGGWKALGTFDFTPKGPARVTIGNGGAKGVVLADCIRVVDPSDKLAKNPAPAVKPKPPPDGVPFDCPPWAYQWRSSEEFEKLGTHRRIRTPDRPENFDAPSRGKGRNPGNDLSGAVLHKWWVELGGMSDIIQDAETIRDELFRINLGMWNYAKNHNPKTISRNKYRELVWLNYVPGVRESRRLLGDYIMTQNDFDKQIVHNDTIGFTDWGIDVHHPEGFWVKGNDCIHVYHGRRVSIPYRSLYSRNIANLFMAGRCHSVTHIALGATRVMRPMMLTGQAAGTAAAIAKQHKTSPRGVYKSHIKQLQQSLLKDGCYLLGIKNADSRDLALSAKLTASSSQEKMAPTKAINGWNRIVASDRNAWTPARGAKGRHWIELRLASKTAVNSVHVTFEKNKSVGFSVEAMTGDEFKTVADLPNNRLRRCVVNFKSVTTDRIRIVFPKIPVICEIRLYNEAAGQDAK
ncbi:MAG: FAD-dependent oxidoreductase [Phycisphaerae bacterium]|nr:FAD-dependent oxidoreductase [Phycisphaerae bacterium]